MPLWFWCPMDPLSDDRARAYKTQRCAHYNGHTAISNGSFVRVAGAAAVMQIMCKSSSIIINAVRIVVFHWCLVNSRRPHFSGSLGEGRAELLSRSFLRIVITDRIKHDDCVAGPLCADSGRMAVFRSVQMPRFALGSPVNMVLAV